MKGTVAEPNKGDTGIILNFHSEIIDFEPILQTSNMLSGHVEGDQGEKGRTIESGTPTEQTPSENVQSLSHNDSCPPIRLINDSCV